MEKIRSGLNKIWTLINKDVAFEDETSQFFVMMRLYYIITLFYIILFNIFIIGAGVWRQIPIMFFWMPLHIAAFYTTYCLRRRAVFHIYSLGLTAWIILAVYYLGWEYGAQYFMYPLLVISFFATYKNRAGKALYTVYICLMHISLYMYAKGHSAVVPLEANTLFAMQTVNTICLFICMYIICMMFSNTNQAALQKLSFYNEKLKQEAETDALTGLMNRRSMYAELEHHITNNSGRSFAIAMGDIDFFKNINDTKGHNCGDHVLCTISEYFKEFMQDKGIVCRWGGEEFLFLFVDQNGDEAYNHVLELNHHIEKMTMDYKGEEVRITMTFGLEEYDFQSSLTVLIKKADDKLYLGKNSGRNQVIF